MAKTTKREKKRNNIKVGDKPLTTDIGLKMIFSTIEREHLYTHKEKRGSQQKKKEKIKETKRKWLLDC